ncbi:MAG: N-acetylmuramic acid 6-phosphate etherase [Pseudomonadota bacterium]|nr:N-acetylmuramic acid 6-phosphate etherase [Pseudomonadota bacterium]
MSTELISSRYADLDLWSTPDAVQAMLEGQLAAAAAVQPQGAAIAAAADAAAARIGGKGRLVYVGAGTSGRLAVQDGVELGPTYDWGSERVVYAIAGGMEALLTSIEGAEDDAAAGAQAMTAAALTPADVVIGVAASGRTPYTVAALRAAAAAGALTIGIANNPGTPLLEAAEHPIFLDTGAEIVAGSTRMKAGTAQKIALNLFSTALMLRLGRVYKGLMVDMRVSNRKLQARAAVMVSEISGVSRAVGEAALAQAGGNIKRAALVALGAAPEQAVSALREAGDNLRVAMGRIGDAGR